jgi:hypothetical protein
MNFGILVGVSLICGELSEILSGLRIVILEQLSHQYILPRRSAGPKVVCLY